MNKREFLKRTLFASAGAAITMVFSADAPAAPNPPPFPGTTRDTLFPNTELMTHTGQTVRFYDDLVKGKIVAFNFFFVSCRDSCPMSTHNLTRLQKLLGDRVGRDIFMYSISLDPDHDRPQVLKSYAELFDVKPGWTFLTGTRDSGNQADIDYLRRRLGFADLDPELDKQRENHVGMLRFGNERRGQWGAMPAVMEPQLLAKEILWMVPNIPPEELRRLSKR